MPPRATSRSRRPLSTASRPVSSSATPPTTSPPAQRSRRRSKRSRAFEAAHPEVEVLVYHANHGFNCDHRGSYDEAAAKLAKERTLAFFAKHVG